MDSRLPTFMWLEPQLRKIEAAGGAYYIRQRGTPSSGTVLVVLRGRAGALRVYQQGRSTSGDLGWAPVFGKEAVEEAKADAYSARAAARDPDLWVVEIETRSGDFPLDGAVFDDLD